MSVRAVERIAVHPFGYPSQKVVPQLPEGGEQVACDASVRGVRVKQRRQRPDTGHQSHDENGQERVPQP